MDIDFHIRPYLQPVESEVAGFTTFDWNAPITHARVVMTGDTAVLSDVHDDDGDYAGYAAPEEAATDIARAIGGTPSGPGEHFETLMQAALWHGSGSDPVPIAEAVAAVVAAYRWKSEHLARWLESRTALTDAKAAA